MADHPDRSEPNAWRGNRPTLTVSLRGPKIPPGRVEKDQLLALLKTLDASLERFASRQLEGTPSLRPGPKTKAAKERVLLYLRSVGSGSATLTFESGSNQRELHGARLGIEVVAEWVEGLDRVGRGEPPPDSFDRGVLSAFGLLEPMFDRGIDEIDFSWESSTRASRATFNPRVSRSIETILALPARNRRTFEGIILEADFHAPDIEFMLYRFDGEPLRCSAPEEDIGTVLGSILHLVQVSGETVEDPETKRVRSVRVDTIKIGEGAGLEGFPVGLVKDFWSGVELGELLERQGISPFDPTEPITWEPPTREEIDRLLRQLAGESEESEET